MDKRIEIFCGDITLLEVEAIVNAAKPSLLGGGGVDGAIHRVAGKELREECKLLNGCKTGEAKITHGYNLKAKYVIHTVGPRYTDGLHNEDLLLRNCYENSLNLAVKNNIKTIAFPSISTGVYGYPIQEAIKIVFTSINDFLKQDNFIDKIILVCFTEEDYNLYISNII